MSLDPNNYKAFLFDAFGTLFQLHPPSSLLEEKHGDKANQMMDLWRNRQLRYTWLHSLMNDYVPFGEISVKALDYAMEVAGIQDDELRSLLLKIYFKATCWPDVPAMLDRMLSKGIQLCILSNGEPHMLEKGARNSGILEKLDHLFSVDEIKIYKPDPRVYQMALDKLGLTKEEVCFFSSNQWDVAGAMQSGLPTAWVNRKNEILEPIATKPNFIIDNFEAL